MKTKIKVRKCKNRNSFRYRFNIVGQAFDLTLKELDELKPVEFVYAVSMKDEDKKHIESKHSHLMG